MGFYAKGLAGVFHLAVSVSLWSKCSDFVCPDKEVKGGLKESSTCKGGMQCLNSG